MSSTMSAVVLQVVNSTDALKRESERQSKFTLPNVVDRDIRPRRAKPLSEVHII